MNNKLYVGNIPYPATEADLKQVFSKIGLVAKVGIVKDQRRRSRGYGFVEMSNLNEAREAVEKLNGHTLNIASAERNLYVVFSV